MHNYLELRVYKEAIDFTADVYKFVTDFPPYERYGLSNQLRRAAVSVPSNIAEGCGRSTDKDTARFVSISIGSLFEVDTQLRLSKKFDYGEPAQLLDRLIRLRKQLIAFHRHLRGTGK